ncbi:HPr family phosphocarrier protein [Desulfomicrobium escambiense]|uniref:HPr family phosphocarrier protein n=1 Tax=Desulfomicrobium escambiense TaxID=29503 RepID=UPI0003FA9788|nr:HPr family phosphocarrier protein [Desulfomicrobium escambiense]
MDDVQERTIRVGNSLGLHARPAGKISQEAQRYAASISVHSGGMEADAKSILDLLSLAAPQGTELRLRAQGPDAVEAISSLTRMFEDMFGEDR